MTHKLRSRLGGFAAVAGVALTVAACGSSSSKSSTSSSASPTPAAATTAGAKTAAGSLTIGTTKGADGTYLVGASGRALYLWVADTGSQSVCSGACAKVWPPVTTTGTPSVSGGVSAADIGTTNRSDGTKQVTYKGHPLYYFVADPSAGTVKGQGSDSFGAKWWLVTPSGSAITTVATAAKSSSASAASTSSSSGSSSGGSSWS